MTADGSVPTAADIRGDRTQREVDDSSPKKPPPRRLAPTGRVYAVAAPALLDRHLQVLGRTERDLLAGLDLDGFTSRRVSPHAGGACPDLQDTEARNPDPFAFLEMLGDQTHEVAEDRLARAFGEFVISRQPCRQMLERNRTTGLATHCHRFARHDACPPQSREMRSWPKKYDSRLEGKQSFQLNMQLARPCGARRKPRLPPAGMGSRGTFRNRSGNEAESQRERRSPCCQHPPAPPRRGRRGGARFSAPPPAAPAGGGNAVITPRGRVNEALTAPKKRLRERR